MLEAARLFALFNAQANREMTQILATLPPEAWTQERGGYYPTLQKLLSHIYVADLAWLVRFTGHRRFASLKGDPFDFPPAPGEVVFATFAEFQDKRAVVDAALIAFSMELTADDMASELSYRNFRGEPFTRNFGGLVLHVFNHGSHHRGMVALYLDQMGVANDFNNLTSVL